MESVLETYLGGVQIGLVPAAAAAALSGGGEPDDIPQTEEPVWILGRKYCAIQEIDQIRRDVQSRLWCTYRKGFQPIGQPGYTSDKGWGCMLRCGQMILAQALIDLHLGRDWFWTAECRDPTYLKIVKRFEDNRQNPYSIHTIALMGDSEDKRVGEWFGPNTVSQVLKKLVLYDDWSSLAIHVALDNMVITDEIVNLCTDPRDHSWKPLLLIVPLRLGLADVNPIYIEGLKRCFEIPGNIGMIGGRPNQALYFIGYVGNEALFLDPHTTQNAGSVGDKSTPAEVDIDATFHQKFAGRIDFKTMDPSLALAFLCRTHADFEELCSRLQSDVLQAGKQPLFEIAKTGYRPWVSQSYHTEQNERLGATSLQEDTFVKLDADQLPPASNADESDDEFEFIA